MYTYRESVLMLIASLLPSPRKEHDLTDIAKRLDRYRAAFVVRNNLLYENNT